MPNTKTKYFLLPERFAKVAEELHIASHTDYDEDTVYDNVDWKDIEEYEGIFPEDRERYKKEYGKDPYRVAGDETVIAVTSDLDKDRLYDQILTELLKIRENQLKVAAR